MLSVSNSLLIDKFSDRENLYFWIKLRSPTLQTLTTPNNIEQINISIKSHLNSLPNSDIHFKNIKESMYLNLIDETTENILKKQESHVILGLIYLTSQRYNFNNSLSEKYNFFAKLSNQPQDEIQNISNIINSHPIFKKDSLTYLISILDSIPDSNFKKQIYINEYINKINDIFEGTDRYKEWIKKDDIIQIEWAQNYLIKHQKIILIPNDFYKNSSYDLVLACIEYLIYSTQKSELQLFVDKMKKSWSQEKYRKSDHNRKKYHMPLIPKAKRQLEELAALKNMQLHHLLEEIIEREYEQNMPKNSNTFLFDKRKK
ncbi:hypothetical protein QSG85_11495 [Acinetobacter baumannii]|uniref:hypothetical protein n=1 Tax=Acinetobacter baumannii TaxID=470 RepID=UPI0029348C19|nr:hypothetical protein [Acinetobacter baumannii]WOE33960.1 hypothetical protein QSG85_11495 [Acinetobacter baumannii]